MLRSYTRQEIFGGINDALLLGDAAELRAAGGYVHKLKQAIKWRHSQAGSASGTLWRCMKLPEDLVYLYRFKGRRFVWPNFISTSRKREEAEKFLGNCSQGQVPVTFRIEP